LKNFFLFLSEFPFDFETSSNSILIPSNCLNKVLASPSEWDLVEDALSLCLDAFATSNSNCLIISSNSANASAGRVSLKFSISDSKFEIADSNLVLWEESSSTCFSKSEDLVDKDLTSLSDWETLFVNSSLDWVKSSIESPTLLWAPSRPWSWLTVSASLFFKSFKSVSYFFLFF